VAVGPGDAAHRPFAVHPGAAVDAVGRPGRSKKEGGLLPARNGARTSAVVPASNRPAGSVAIGDDRGDGGRPDRTPATYRSRRPPWGRHGRATPPERAAAVRRRFPGRPRGGDRVDQKNGT
jgi:hypothetical protein